eukprot:358843-Chlamydomonas_euryale.AAC.2
MHIDRKYQLYTLLAPRTSVQACRCICPAHVHGLTTAGLAGAPAWLPQQRQPVAALHRVCACRAWDGSRVAFPPSPRVCTRTAPAAAALHLSVPSGPGRPGLLAPHPRTRRHMPAHAHVDLLDQVASSGLVDRRQEALETLRRRRAADRLLIRRRLHRGGPRGDGTAFGPDKMVVGLKIGDLVKASHTPPCREAVARQPNSHTLGHAARLTRAFTPRAASWSGAGASCTASSPPPCPPVHLWSHFGEGASDGPANVAPHPSKEGQPPCTLTTASPEQLPHLTGVSNPD